jgi:hypothetical protein
MEVDGEVEAYGRAVECQNTQLSSCFCRGVPDPLNTYSIHYEVISYTYNNHSYQPGIPLPSYS